MSMMIHEIVWTGQEFHAGRNRQLGITFATHMVVVGFIGHCVNEGFDLAGLFLFRMI